MSGFLRTTLLISWNFSGPSSYISEPVMIKCDEQNCGSYLRTHLALIFPLSPVHVMMREAHRVAAHGAHL